MIIAYLAKKILLIKKESPVLVAIDGVDGAGKTFFAKKLVSELENQKRKIINASIDNFHNNEIIRYKKGKDSPEGFYFDSFNYKLLKNKLLNPFLSGEGKYIDIAFDCVLNSEVNSTSKSIEKNSILIMEGIFLLRSELIKYWDLKIFLDVDFNITLERNIQRSKNNDKNISVENIIDKFNKRYMLGQKIYFLDSNPKAQANIIIDNSDFDKPKIIKDLT